MPALRENPQIHFTSLESSESSITYSNNNKFRNHHSTTAYPKIFSNSLADMEGNGRGMEMHTILGFLEALVDTICIDQYEQRRGAPRPSSFSSTIANMRGREFILAS